MRVITNNVPRDLIDAWELTPAEREEFDYLDWAAIELGEDSASFFRFHGDLYDLGEFSVWQTRPDMLREWDGYASDSAFSATVVRYVDNCERIVVGRVLS